MGTGNKKLFYFNYYCHHFSFYFISSSSVDCTWFWQFLKRRILFKLVFWTVCTHRSIIRLVFCWCWHILLFCWCWHILLFCWCWHILLFCWCWHILLVWYSVGADTFSLFPNCQHILKGLKSYLLPSATTILVILQE